MPKRKDGTTASPGKARSSKASAKRKKIPPPLDLKALRSGHQAVYGDALRQAIARGDINEMRKVITIARKWLKDVQGAVRNLESSVRKLER